MTEKTLKYMGVSLNYKEIEIPEKTDNYRRPLKVKVAKQSDAEQITDEETGLMRWTGGPFFDMQINLYVADDVYEDDDKLFEVVRKEVK